LGHRTSRQNAASGREYDVTLVVLADLLDSRGMAGQRWRAQAARRGADVAIFMPERGERLDEARAYCSRCDVRVECLEYAMSFGADLCHGVWAGASGRDRRRARRNGWDARRLLAELDR
jgi:hypothetical protein